MTVERDDSRLRGTLFMPCVLDRLTDLNPETRVERFSRGVSISALRRSVLENVSLILNSRSHPGAEAWGGDAEVSSSVLGLGLSDFCGSTGGLVRRERLREEIVRQLRTFEPRFLPDSVRVDFTGEHVTDGGVLEMEVRAIISVAPLKEELVFRARLNMETGESAVVTSEDR